MFVPYIVSSIYDIQHEHTFDFIECFTTTFLRAHSWLNWVDEDDDEDEVGLKEKPKDYIEIRPEAPGVWNKGLT